MDMLPIQDFIPKLKDHLLGHLWNQLYDGDQDPFSDHDCMSVHIVDNRIYSSQVLRIDYTTYDIHRDQDSVNPHTHPDIMVLSSIQVQGSSASKNCICTRHRSTGI